MIVSFHYMVFKLTKWSAIMKKIIFSGAILLIPILLVAQGSTYKIGTTIRISEEDTISTNVIAAGQFVDIYGYLGDDLFAASRNLIINGSISDDAIVAARNVTVSGTVGDMLIAGGETVLIDGEVDGDLFAAGSEVRIAPNARIHGNVALAGREVIFEGGSIDGWLRASGAKIRLDGTVQSYTELYSTDVTFGDNYQGMAGTSITTDEEIDPSTLGNAPDDLKIVQTKEDTWMATFFVGLWFYTSILLTGILLIAIFRETTVDLHRFSTENYFKNTGLGFLLFLGIPIASIILLILVLTIPISVLLMVFYGLALFFGYLLVALTIGTLSIRLFKPGEAYSDYYWGLALGILLTSILSVLPLVGWFINLLLIFFGLGTLASYFWKMRANSM